MKIDTHNSSPRNSYRLYRLSSILVGNSCKRIPLIFRLAPVLAALIIYMKKLLDSDWLRAVQFKRNTSAKSVTPVQKV